MRIMGFSHRWPKLEDDEFTTFRFGRRDKDWQIGESVQVVTRPRSKGREVLGVAIVNHKEPRQMASCGSHVDGSIERVTDTEAVADGFEGYRAMWSYLVAIHGASALESRPMNKLTLRWVPARADN